jgi:hypothetical protein
LIYNDSVSQNSEVGLGLARGGPGFTVAFRATAHVRLGPGRYRAQSPFARMPSRRLRREKFHPDRRTGCPGRARGHGFNRTAEIKIGVVGPAPHDRQQIRASVGSLGPGAAMRFPRQSRKMAMELRQLLSGPLVPTALERHGPILETAASLSCAITRHTFYAITADERAP